jgi:hypothetical protein
MTVEIVYKNCKTFIIDDEDIDKVRIQEYGSEIKVEAIDMGGSSFFISGTVIDARVSE